MYEELTKPLREIARREPLEERARQMFTVPTEIPEATVNAMPAADRKSLTLPIAPATAALYSLAGQHYVLNGRVSDLTAKQKNRILAALKKPNGIRMVRVAVDNSTGAATLEVHFFNVNFLSDIVKAYDTNNSSAKNLFPISGGSRLRAGAASGQVQIDSSIAPAVPAVTLPNKDQPVLVLQVKPIGDYSTYTLNISQTAISTATFDPLFSEISFKFRPGCFNANCAPEWEVSPAPPSVPTIDYLAKDYESFRLQMIAAMMQRVPGWEATSEADLDVTLLELFSAAADELSDYQDRVMNEAFFAACRKRVSLARHARMLDYHIHQGNQATTWLALEIEHETGTKKFELSDDFKVWAGESVIDAVTKEKDAANSAIVFHSRNGKPQVIHQLLNNIGLYTWSDSIPVLKAGSTQADLKLYNKFYLGDPAIVAENTEAAAKIVRDLIIQDDVKYLLIEEHLNPKTGLSAGRDPAKRQLLKLLPNAEAMRDPITDQWFVRVRWEKADALRRDYCFTVDCPEISDGTALGKVENVSLFHANLLEVSHGRLQKNIFKEPGETLIFNPANPLEFHYQRTRWGALCRLPEKFLAYRNTAAGGDVAPLSTLKVSIETNNLMSPLLDETANFIHSDGSTDKGNHFVVETDENRRSFVRFGNGVNGMELPDKAIVHCEYQFGEPLEGNVGAETLVNFSQASIVSVPPTLKIRSCQNPFDVSSGKDIEPITEIIRRVPEAYRTRQLRAVTAADYIARAEEVEGVSRAAARYLWTGSWRTVRVTIDPLGTNELTDELRRRVAEYLEAVRLIGEDIEIRPPKFVPLEIKVKVCAAPGVWTDDLRYILEQEFSTGWLPDGRRGFFHPDSWTFGQPLRASQITGRALAVKGVEHVVQISIKRWNSPFPASDAFTKLNHNEIIEVLSDPDFLERGSVSFEITGGRR